MNQATARTLQHPGYLEPTNPRAEVGATGRPTAGAGGDRHGFVHETLCYVPMMARRYRGRGLTFEELVAAGNLGLVEASLRYDPARGVKFKTYATWWIRKGIIEALNRQAGPIRLPRYQYDKLKQLRDTRATWFAAHGRDPSMRELATAAELPICEVHRLLTLSPETVSLDDPVTRDESLSLKETIEDVECEKPDHAFLRRDLEDRLWARFAELVSRDRQVLSLRYGLDGEEALTLRETSRRLGISCERVRRVQNRALAQLRERI